MRRQIPHCLMGIFFCLVFVGLVHKAYAEPELVGKYIINNSEEKNWYNESGDLIGSDETHSVNENNLSLKILAEPNNNIFGAKKYEQMPYEAANNLTSNNLNIETPNFEVPNNWEQVNWEPVSDYHIGDLIYGAANFSDSESSANSNIVNINKSDLNKVYGGYVLKTGKANSNEISISNSKIYNELSGGYIDNWETDTDYMNSADNNKVNVGNSKINISIYGGKINVGSGSASFNEVTVNKSNIEDIDIYDSFIYGGYVAGNGKADSNKVTISNSTVKGQNTYTYIFGAYVGENGTADSNCVSISDSSINITDINAIITGGFAGNEGSANSNNVIISNSVLNLNKDSYLTGGESEGSANSNKVIISNSILNLNKDLYLTGGESDFGTANYNTVDINKSKIFANDGAILKIFSGVLTDTESHESDDSSYNKVNLAECNIEGYNAFIVGAKLNNCNTHNNIINITNSTFTTDVTNIYGSLAIQGNAENNEINVTDSTFNTQLGNIYGAYIQNEGNANYNKVNVCNTDIGSRIYGGYTKNGETRYNEVTITDCTKAEEIYGGNQEKTGNKLFVNGEANSAFNIYNFETINFNIATASTDKALLSIADATYTVDLSKVTINTTDIPIKDSNSITLIKTQKGIDYSNNIFKINDIECTDGSLGVTEADKTNKWVKSSVYQYDTTSVPNNLVLKYDTIVAAAYTDNTGKKTSTTFNYLIMSDEISEMKHIYGSFSEKGDATGATVKINKTIDLSNTNLIGGYSADGGNVQDNILEVSASDVKIKSIDKFDNYVFTLDSEKHGKNIISTADSVDMTGVSIKVHLLAGSLAKNQQITLMDKVNNVDLTKLSINGINSQSVKNAFNQKSEYLIIGETAFTTEDNKLGLVGKDAFITAAFVNSKGKILEKSNRTITLSDKVTDYDRIFGTYSEKGDATGATVKIDTTLDLSNTSLIGGYSEDGGKVSDNTLEVSASDLNINSIENFDNYVFTLNSEKYGKNIISTADKVDLKDASINVSLSDGSLAKNQQIILLDKVNNVDVNKLSINGINGQSLKFASAEEDSEYVTVGETAFITENNKLGLVGKEAFLTASYADKNGEILEKSDKTIILSDTATAYDTIYGMYSDNGSAIGATIKINTSLDLSNTNLIGGYAPKGFEVAGCTLDISAKDITVNSVSAFDKIGFTLNSDITSSETVLKTKEAVNLKDITIDVKLDPADDNFVINKGEKILLADNVTGKDTAIFNINGEARDSISNVATHDEYVRVRSFGYDKTDSSNLAIIGIDNFAAGCFIDADNKSYETKSGKVITLGKSSSANIKANVRAANSGSSLDFSKMSDIYGIYSDGSADATGAEVNIDSAINYNDTILHGGYSRLGKVYGNTLNIRAANSRVKGITDFENLNFVLGADIKNGDTMLKVAEKVDLEPTNNIGVDGTSATGLHAGDSVNLLVSEAGIEGFGTQNIKLEGLTDKNGIVELSDSNTLKLNLKKETPNANTKAPAEGITASAILVNEACDLTAGALNRSMLEMDSNDMNTFAAIGGGHTKTETGSYVKNNSWNLGFGIGKKGLSTKNPNTTYGMFFQYGKSNFDTHNGSFRGDGDAKNLGFGLMYHNEGRNNYYYDGAAYIGKLDAKWSCVAGGYDESATYRGITLGMGHRNYVKDNRVVDTYGKYFFNHTNAMSGVIDGHSYSFDSVDSSRLRLGLRIEQIKNTSARPYFGFAWEHEFSGDARSTMDLGRVDAPSLKGDTGIVEVGYKWKRGNWDINVNAEGSFGKREGVTGAASFYYNF